MLPKVPESVSYESLLSILQDRIVKGNIPDDNEYFAELIFGLCRRADMARQVQENKEKAITACVVDITPYLSARKKSK